METLKILIETFVIFILIKLTKKPIILGPYHGEFGFEVSMNTSIAYSIKRKFKNKLIVVSLDGNEGLYDFCDKFIGFNYDLKDAGYGYGKIEDSLKLRNDFKKLNNEFSSCIFIDLTRINIYLLKKLINFSFVDLSKFVYNPNSNEIAIHFRSILKSGIDDRSNFSNENADILVKELTLKGFIINIIGHPKFSYCPSDFCIDRRSINISAAIDNIQKSLITIGQLSGPIHLAHLCNRPVLTWADDKKRFDTVKMWNPHNQKCIIISDKTFNPNIYLIIDKLNDFKNE